MSLDLLWRVALIPGERVEERLDALGRPRSRGRIPFEGDTKMIALARPVGKVPQRKREAHVVVVARDELRSPLVDAVDDEELWLSLPTHSSAPPCHRSASDASRSVSIEYLLPSDRTVIVPSRS